MNTSSQECCERRRLAAGGCHWLAVSRGLRRRGSNLQSNVGQNIRRSGVYCFVSVLEPAAGNSVGPRPASRVLLSSVLFQFA